MSVSQPQPRVSALAIMAQRCNVEPGNLNNALRQTIMPIVKGSPLQVSNEHLLSFVVVANQYNLNPFTREIFAFPSKAGGITPIVSIDGWLKLMNEHEQFDGMEIVLHGDGENPESVTVTVHRKDRSHTTIVTEYFSECHRNTEPWNQFPRRMLRHKGIKEAARVAFGFAGLYDEDDAELMAMRNVTPQGESVAEEAEERTEQVPAQPLQPVETEVVRKPEGEPAETPQPAETQAQPAPAADAPGEPEDGEQAPAPDQRAENLDAIEQLRKEAGYSVDDFKERCRRVGIMGPRGKFSDLDAEKTAAVINRWGEIMDADPPDQTDGGGEQKGGELL